jgi:hypothetical protein
MLRILSKSIPGVQAFSITHDLAMAPLQVALNNNLLYKVLNPLTIVPVAAVQYMGFGVQSTYYNGKLLRRRVERQ